MWLFEMRSIEAQLLGVVLSSIMGLASGQMGNHLGGFLAAQKVRQLTEHLLREFPDILVGPVFRLRDREDRRKLFGGETAIRGWIITTAIPWASWSSRRL